MSSKPIQITEFDLERLKKLLFEARYNEYRKSQYLEKLDSVSFLQEKRLVR